MRKKLFTTMALTLVLSGCSAAQDINPQEQFVYDAIVENKEDGSEMTSEVVEAQNQAIEELKSEYAKGEYTLESPFIAVDPFSTNNLSAYVAFESDSKITYTYTVHSKEGSTSPDFTYTMDEATKGTVIIPVVALYENYDNQVTISVTDKKETTDQDIVIKTGKSADNAEEMVVRGKLNDEVTANDKKRLEEYQVDTPEIDIEILDDSVLKYFDNGFLLMDTYDIYDIDGNLRFSSPSKTLSESGLKMQDGRFVFFKEDRTTAYYADLMGRVYSQFKIPEIELAGTEGLEFHHDSVITPDGKSAYILAGFKEVTEDELDADSDMQVIMENFIFKYDINGGYPTDVFDVTDYFYGATTSDEDPVDAITKDPIHMNSIDYYEEQNELIISGKRQGHFFALDADNGDLVWQYKMPSEVLEQNEDKTLTITNPDEFKYTSGNHAAFVMRTDKYMTTAKDLYLSVFNNNNCVESENKPSFANPFEGESSTCNWNDYSAMEIYHIDPKNMTITFEEELIPDDNRFSSIMSSAFTNHPGIYELNYTMDILDNNQQIFQASFTITDEEGTPLLNAEYLGLGMVYRSRLISGDEISQSLVANVENL